MRMIMVFIAIIAIVGFFVVGYNQLLTEQCSIKGGNVTESYRCINADGRYID